MIHLFSKKRIGILLAGGLFITCLFGAGHAKYTRNDLKKPFDDGRFANGNIEQDNKKFEILLTTFCTTMTKDGQQENGTQEATKSFTNAQESLFMYVLCYNIDQSAAGFQNNKGLKTLKEKKSFLKFVENAAKEEDKKPIVIQQLDGIDYYKDTEEYIDTLFSLLINSYTNIYQAGSFGIENSTESIDDNVSNFAKKFFPRKGYKDDILNPCMDGEAYTLPKTCRLIKNTINTVRNNSKSKNNIVFSDLVLAYYNGIQATEPKNEICNKPRNNGPNPKYQIVPCGLYGDMNAFIMLLYNELFFYTTFVEYYNQALGQDFSFKNAGVTDKNEQKELQNTRRDQLKRNNLMHQKAIATTIKMLNEIKSTYPLHIGLLMYAETIYNFSQAFSKTIVPIYTLYDLFRNVQKAQ